MICLATKILSFLSKWLFIMKKTMESTAIIVTAAAVVIGAAIGIGGFLFFRSRQPKGLEELTLRNLIKEANDRLPKDDDNIVQFAARKELQPNKSFKVTVAYLNENGKPVFTSSKGEKCGFSILAKKLDSELSDMFADKDMILFN